MLRERAIQELVAIKDMHDKEEYSDEQSKEAVIMVVQKFCEDLGFSDVSIAIVEAWQGW